MITSEVPVIEQFLAGRPEGPISMDEMADAVEGEDESDGSPPDTPPPDAIEDPPLDVATGHNRSSPFCCDGWNFRKFKQDTADTDFQAVNPGVAL